MTAREPADVERSLRLVALLDSCSRVGLAPVPIGAVHSIAYLADALAPVWHLPVLDAQVLKRRRRPFFPILQHDLDRLVGMGVMRVTRLAYEHAPDGQWQLDADYILDDRIGARIISAASDFDEQARKVRFVREVVFSVSGLGLAGISEMGILDAAYSDPEVDFGSIVEIVSDSGKINETARVARRFSELLSGARQLSESELIHLYARHLYSRMRDD